MASSDLPHSLTTLTSFLVIVVIAVSGSESHRRCYDSIISFGDSIADTGNLLHLLESDKVPPHFSLPPYGETFFHHPTGRYCDGRLIIDFIAEFLDLPYVPAYFGSQNGSFEKGINFAVAGATALDVSFFREKGVLSYLTNVSLGVQLSIFREVLPKICGSSSDCSEFLSSSLILMGEIGGNDYNYPFMEGKSIKHIKEIVPSVIKAISSAIEELVNVGGKTFLVPGNFPIGCSTVYLTTYQTANIEEYDPSTGCLKWLNEFAEYHNEQLQTELNRLRKLYPQVTIIYGDYYNVVSRLYHQPTKYGFKNRPLAACCGIGGPYNYSASRQCGYGAPCCANPSEYVNWDGFHFTEAAYRWIAQGLLKGPYADPAFNSSCFYFTIQNASQENNKSLSI